LGISRSLFRNGYGRFPWKFELFDGWHQHPETLELINGNSTYHVFVIRAVYKSGSVNSVCYQANYATVMGRNYADTLSI
jgi:hypothetical protein